MKKELTEKQKLFLSYLMDEAGGNIKKAMNMAGYAETTKTRDVVKSLRNEILEEVKDFISSGVATKAAFVMKESLERQSGESAIGLRERITAARDILDRAGVANNPHLELPEDRPVFIIPPKVKKTEEDGD